MAPPTTSTAAGKAPGPAPAAAGRLRLLAAIAPPDGWTVHAAADGSLVIDGPPPAPALRRWLGLCAGLWLVLGLVFIALAALTALHQPTAPTAAAGWIVTGLFVVLVLAPWRAVAEAGGRRRCEFAKDRFGHRHCWGPLRPGTSIARADCTSVGVWPPDDGDAGHRLVLAGGRRTVVLRGLDQAEARWLGDLAAAWAGIDWTPPADAAGDDDDQGGGAARVRSHGVDPDRQVQR